ncbi:MAG: SDR family NAD(P)-dependent oxidoreductase [Tepidisphaeraceae bacterium]
MSTLPLTGKVALVTGASRGIGRGIAIGLGEAGATVYVTGRTERESDATVRLPGTIGATADAVTAAGGRGIAVRCDHREDAQTREVIERLRSEQGRLDILVNNVWGGYEHYNNGTEFWLERGFWTAPLGRWDTMFAAGVRAHYITSCLAMPLLLDTATANGATGLVVNTSFEASMKTDAGVAYGAAKAASDHMVRCMAHELREHPIAVVAIHPGLVRTEGVMAHEQYFAEQLARNSELPQFIGRAVTALARDPDVKCRSGQVVKAATLGLEYGFTDIDGRQPQP